MHLQQQVGNASTTAAIKGTGAVTAAVGKYLPGQHGGKQAEQARLGKAFGQKVDGTTHESEHVLGYKVLVGETPGYQRGDTATARQLERDAWAYQEDKPSHRAHIGTGVHNTADASGMNSADYRDAQRGLLTTGGDDAVSSAVQLNQLGYAFRPEFREGRGGDASGSSTSRAVGHAAADDSYTQMVRNMDNIEVVGSGATGESSLRVDAYSRAEMLLAREAAATGAWPTQERIDEVLHELGL